MPDIAVPTAQPTASFLAIGAPVVADSAVSGDFAAILVQQDGEIATPALPETGKVLPATRQDLAALPLPVAGNDETQGEPAKPIIADLPKALAIRSVQADAAKPQPIAAETQEIDAATAEHIIVVKADAPRKETKAPVAETPAAPIMIVRKDKLAKTVEGDTAETPDTDEKDMDEAHAGHLPAAAPIIVTLPDARPADAPAPARNAAAATPVTAQQAPADAANATPAAAPIIVTLPDARPADAPVPARKAAVVTPVTAQQAPAETVAAKADGKSEAKIVVPAAIIPVAPVATPVEATAAKDAIAQSLAFAARPIVASPAPVAAPVAASSVTFTMQPAAIAAAAPAIEIVAAPVPTATAIAARQAAQPIETAIADAPRVEAEKAAPVAIAVAATTPPPAAEARAVGFAALAEGFGQPVPGKAKPRDASIAVTDAAAIAAPAPIEIRTVQAATAPAIVAPLGERATVMIETIEALRLDARSASLDVAIRHEDFGAVTLNFEQTDDDVTVRVNTRDAELARMIADAAPALKASGEPLNVRVERRDGAGVDGSRGNTQGGSQDAPRQGRDQGRAQEFVQQPQHRSQRGRGGIFA